MSDIILFLDNLFNLVCLPLSVGDLHVLLFSLPWIFFFFGLFFVTFKRFLSYLL